MTVPRSGLATIEDILHGINGIAFAHLASEDVVRHALVGKIVQAYDRHAAIAGDHGRRRHRKNDTPHGPAGRTEEHNSEAARQNAQDGDENLGAADSKTHNLSDHEEHNNV